MQYPCRVRWIWISILMVIDSGRPALPFAIRSVLPTISARGCRTTSRFKMLVDDARGQVLLARPGAERALGEDFYAGTAIVVVEHEFQGASALVINRPTPLLIDHCDLPRFHAFRSCRLFHGGNMQSEPDDSLFGGLLSDPAAPRRRKNVTGASNLLSNALPSESGDFESHNISPHFWIHRVDGVKGSCSLDGSGIFLGALRMHGYYFFAEMLGGALFAEDRASCGQLLQMCCTCDMWVCGGGLRMMHFLTSN